MKNWTLKPLASITKTFDDGDWIESKDQSEDGVRLIQTGNVGVGIFKGRAEKARYISEDTFQRLRCTEIVEGDCLISRLPDPVGRSCMLPNTGDKMITAVDCTIARFDTAIVIPEFFCFYSQSRDYLRAVESETSGTTRKRISRSKLGEIPIPLPPLREQQHIVALLDEAFEGLAIATANTEKNLKNAREVFEGYLSSLFDRVDDDWAIVDFEDCICDVKYTSKINRKNFLRTGRFPIVSQEAEFINGYWDDSSDVFRVDSPLVIFGDHTRILKYVDFDFVLGADGVKLLKPKEILDPRFFYFILRSLPISAKGYARHYSVLKKLKLSFPKKLVLQKEIALKLDGLEGEIARMEVIYEDRLRLLAELKQSLLQKAFTGELTKKFRPSVVASAAAPKVSSLSTADLHAGILAMAFDRHHRHDKHRTFGHVKAQKFLHLVESVGRIDLGRVPIKDAAGPNDFPHMLRAEEWAKQKQFFEFAQRPSGTGYDFKKLARFDDQWKQANAALEPFRAALNKVIDLIIDMNSEEAELFATVHAAWNNLIIDKVPITDQAIVREARENWHKGKLKIPEQRFHNALNSIRTRKLEPDGTAKYVGGQRSLI